MTAGLNINKDRTGQEKRREEMPKVFLYGIINYLLLNTSGRYLPKVVTISNVYTDLRLLV